MSRTSVRITIVVLFVVVVAFLLRCHLIGDVFLDGHVLPFDPDSSYHLWRIEEAAHKKGIPPRADPFLNAPDGARVIWPDGFDGVLGLLVYLLTWGRPSRFATQVISLFAVPLLSVLSIWVVYRLARRVGTIGGALVAVSIAACLPAHVVMGLPWGLCPWRAA